MPAAIKMAGRLSGNALGVQGEALIIGRRNFREFFAIDADATWIRHEDMRLTGDVGSHLPGVGLWKEGHVRQLVDM